MMKPVKGILLVCDKEDASRRTVRYPRSGLRTRPRPLPLLVIKMDVTEGGKPLETPLLAGFIEQVYLVGNEVHCEGALDPDTEAGAKAISWLGRVGTMALAPDLVEISEALDFSPEALELKDYRPELLSWTIAAANLVHDDYAPWAEARLSLAPGGKL